MKISKNEPLETPTADDDNENIQLDIHEPQTDPPVEPAKKKRVYVKKTPVLKPTEPEEPEEDVGQHSIDAPKIKRQPTEKQLLNWAKCLEARKASCEKRKAEKEEQEKQRQADLENKIIVKAKRIRKAQTRVLGDLDELAEPEPVVVKQKKPRIKKQVIIYDNDDDEMTEVKVIMNLPKRNVVFQSLMLHLLLNLPKPVLSKSIMFI